jgi:hypothetical protein
MAKMTIKVNGKHKTSGLICHNHDECIEEVLSPEAAREYFAECDPAKLALYVVSYDKNNPYGSIGFEFSQESLKKGGAFSVELKRDGTGLVADVSGEFTVKLRSGVEKNLAPNVVFKLQGICYKGGAWNGFMAYLDGQTEDNVADWVDVADVTIK